MGVMACNRSNCGEIMCYTYAEAGYICTDCEDEFQEKMKGRVEVNVNLEFKHFMETDKQNKFKQDPDNIDWVKCN